MDTDEENSINSLLSLKDKQTYIDQLKLHPNDITYFDSNFNETSNRYNIQGTFDYEKLTLKTI